MPLTYRGRTQTLAAWAKDWGLSKSGLRKRLALGWDLEKIRNTPPQKELLITANGATRTLKQWAKQLGVPKATLANRIYTLEQSFDEALTGHQRIRHGLSDTKAYKAWKNMRSRCNNPNDPRFRWYGGRGIKICTRWNLFARFLADMGPPPARYTLERKDFNGMYCPENCVWTTQKEQTRNTRRNVRLTFAGETLCVSEWAEKLQLSYTALIQRIRHGWSVERTLTTPVGKTRREQSVYRKRK
jgi:hypothetical protein